MNIIYIDNMTIAILIHNTVNCKWNGCEIGRTVEMDDKRAGMKMRGDEGGEGSTSVGAPSWCDRSAGIVPVIFAARCRSYI